MPRSSYRRAAAALSLGALLVSIDAAVAQQPPAPPEARSEPVTFSLESTDGGRVSLASLRGKVVVLFYEDRAHTEDNAELKGLLAQYARDNDLVEQVGILPIANVAAYNFRPASDFARTAIRAVARQIRVELLMDWTGALQAAPFSLRSSASNVVVVDRSGRIVYRHAGAVVGEARSRFFRAVRRAIRDRDGDGEPDAAAPVTPPAAR